MQPGGNDAETFDAFVKLVKANLKAKQDKATEAKYKQIGDAASALQDFSSLLGNGGKGLTPDDKKKALKAALKTLIKALCGPRTEDSDIPNEITNAIDALTDPDPTHKKQWDDALKALNHWLARVIVKNPSIVTALSGKDKKTEALKGIDELVGKVDTLVKVLCGNVTDAERDKILEDSLMDLLTSTVVVEQLKWFVTENALTYVQAVKIGYQLAEPIGKQIAQDLTAIIGAQLGKNVIQAFESGWTSAANGQKGDKAWSDAVAYGDRPTVKLTGAFKNWTAQAYYDAGANGIRIVCQNGDQVIVLDGNGAVAVDSTPLPSAADLSTGGAGASDGTEGYRPWLAFKTALDKSKGLKAEMDAADAAMQPSLTAYTALKNEEMQLLMAISTLDAKIFPLEHGLPQMAAEQGVKFPDLARLRAERKEKQDRLAEVRLQLPGAYVTYHIAHGAYFLKYIAYTNAVKAWLMKAAAAENWSDKEIGYANLTFKGFEFARSEIPSIQGGFGVAGPGGRSYAPTGLSAVAFNYIRANRTAQVGIVVVALVAALLGTNVLRIGAGQQNPSQLSAATVPPTTAGTAPASARATLAALDACSLITTQEAATILGKTVTANGSSLQCFYKPQSQVVFTFAHPECGASGAAIKIDEVDITYSTGSDAAQRYAAKDARFGQDRQYDQRIDGLGDKAVQTGTELSVLKGSSFINVKPQGTIDCSGSGATRFEDVYQKYQSVLIAFAKAALARVP